MGSVAAEFSLSPAPMVVTLWFSIACFRYQTLNWKSISQKKRPALEAQAVVCSHSTVRESGLKVFQAGSAA